MTVIPLGPQKQMPLLVPQGFPSPQLMLGGEEEQIPLIAELLVGGVWGS